MIEAIVKHEKELFQEWRKTTPNLSEDGIVDPESYLNAEVKILFLLKEVNSDEGFDLKVFIREGGRSQTWDNIAKWTFGILNWSKEYNWKEMNHINDVRQHWLRKICVMNIKKTPGGHTSNLKTLWADSLRDKVFLNRQFQLYYDDFKMRPDFIIGCGSSTTNFFHEIVPFSADKLWSKTTRGVFYYEFEPGKFFIKYVHPEARVADNLLYYGLIDAVKELKGFKVVK